MSLPREAQRQLDKIGTRVLKKGGEIKGASVKFKDDGTSYLHVSLGTDISGSKVEEMEKQYSEWNFVTSFSSEDGKLIAVSYPKN